MATLKQFFKFLIFSFFIFSLTSCATSSTTNAGDTDTLIHIQALKGVKTKQKSKELTSIREDALRETAMSLGAQGGLAWRAKQINMTLKQNAVNLDHAFNFNLLLLPHNVLPPVLTEGDNSLNLDNDDTIRIADRTYKIESQARFVTVSPTWRDYLWLNYAKPEVPDNSLLPQTSDEIAIWKKYTMEGWQEGVMQADAIYAQNLARLKRDYSGMIRYSVLLTQHMVSAPYVARSDLGVTGGGSDMRVNDQVLRITALPSLQANSKLWKPVIQNDNNINAQ